MTAPSDSPSNPGTGWERFRTGAARSFHAYAGWLVGISWKRFFVLSLLLIIAAAVVQSLPPFSWTIKETIHDGDENPQQMRDPAPPPLPPRTRNAGDAGKRAGKSGGLDISIDDSGIRIRSRAKAASSPPASASAASSGESSDDSRNSIDIKLPPGLTSETRSEILAAVEDAKQAIEDAEAAKHEASAAVDELVLPGRGRVRIREVRWGDFLTQLALLWIVGSAILKATYKGRVQAEVKAAQATETAESETLKRQVVEARMAAMQAQVEPHFLFNTLASIDHLIETDPPRASTMQKNLIALLRASMPTMRETHPSAHNLGREMAVIRPYLEILKVRMEDRLLVDIDVPDGLLSADFPSMMIQSLVENAIKHGLEPKAEGGRLTVRAEIIHGKLAVTVADTGLGFGKAATAGTGVGLANIRERLKLLYGNRASIVVAENRQAGTMVTLAVPYQAQARAGESA